MQFSKAEDLHLQRTDMTQKGEKLEKHNKEQEC